MSFGANKPSYDVLMSAQSGEIYDIEVFKNPQGFNDWIGAQKSTGAAPASTPTVGSINNKHTATAYTATPKSTYETPEERAIKQIYIVRQSNITAAIAALSVGAKSPPKIEDIIDTAKKFENHVFGSTKEDVPVEKSFDVLDTMDDDPIPY